MTAHPALVTSLAGTIDLDKTVTLDLTKDLPQQLYSQGLSLDDSLGKNMEMWESFKQSVSEGPMGALFRQQATAGNAERVAIYGVSTNNLGVYGESFNDVGVFGTGGRLAAKFDGDVEVTGDIRLVNADCAEDFDVLDCDALDPGTVMVLGEESLMQASQAYDKRVAGVVSGAGDYKPGIV